MRLRFTCLLNFHMVSIKRFINKFVNKLNKRFSRNNDQKINIIDSF